MLDKLRKLISKYRTREVRPVDPRVFDDHVAMNTQWTPLVIGGVTFTSHTIERERDSLSFQPTVNSYLCVAFFGVPGVIMIGLALVYLTSQSGELGDNAGLLGFGVVFCLVAIVIANSLCHRSTFDRRRGIFYRALAFYKAAPGSQHGKNSCALSEIHALQIVEEIVDSEDGSYFSYQLNLVLQNGRRINVIDHSNLSQVRKDSVVLAQFLNCPLWDSTAVDIADYGNQHSMSPQREW